MGELVSFGRLCVRNLAKKLRRNGTVKDKISIKELHLLDGLPSSDGRRTGCGPREVWIVMEFWLCLRVRLVRVVWGQYGSSIIVLVILLVLSWIRV